MKWLKWNLETFPGGVSTAVSADLLPNNQASWAGNVSFRGGKAQTRPSIACRISLPNGLFQGGSYFGVQGGMIVLTIEGRPYRIRIGYDTFSFEPIALRWYNSGIIKQNFYQQTVETLVIQDGQSSPILYNGSIARRADIDEVPIGRQMAYGNGRLWVAVNNKKLLAGDIRQNMAGTELKFTEINYLTGGGSLYFPQGITGLAFIPVTGTTDYGTLLCGGQDYTVSIRADITSRDQWATYPGFVTNVLNSTGMVSDWSIVEVNQDLYWRDSHGGIRSLKSSVADESGPGNTPISREVSRLVDYDSEQLLPFCSGIYHQNRLLMTSSPFLNKQGGVSWKNLVSLDFAPVSTMQGKSQPAYNGQWNGVNWSQLFSGKFDGVNRAFGVSSDEDGVNRLWELDVRGTVDLSLSCGSAGSPNPVTAYVEYPKVDFGDKTSRKRLERCDVYVSELIGDLELTAYWRPDDAQKWTQWDSVETCAQTTDDEVSAPHTWKNLLPQQRPQIKTFTIPDGIDEVTKYSLHVGFKFQIRLVWVGRCKIQKIIMLASPLEDSEYANRESLSATCIENDVTGNEINYQIPLADGCPYMTVDEEGDFINNGTMYDFGPVTDQDIIKTFRITNDGGLVLNIGTITLANQMGSAFELLNQPADTSLNSGESTTFQIKVLSTDSTGQKKALIAIPNNTDVSPFTFNPIAKIVSDAVMVDSVTYFGNLKWFGFLPYDYTGVDTEVPERYLSKTGSGTNILTFGGDFFFPDPVTPAGTVNNNFSGARLVDPTNGAQSGMMTKTSVINGMICNGSSYLYANNLQETTTNTNIPNLLNGRVAAPKIVTFHLQQQYITDPNPGPGYNQTYCGSGINSQHSVTLETLGNRMTVAQAAIAGGAGIVTSTNYSETTSYDSGTGIGNGTFTTMHFRSDAPSTSGKFLVISTYKKVLIGGGPEEIITRQNYYTVGIGTYLDVYDIIPDYVGYRVTLDTIRIYDFFEVSDDFSQCVRETRFYGDQPGFITTDFWPDKPLFGMPLPGSEAGTDWDPNQLFGELTSDITGFYWASDAVFSGVDRTGARDDFEAYPAGTILEAGEGLGWAGIGRFQIFDVAIFGDDFESYAVGTITSLNFGTGVYTAFGGWVADGSFTVVEYLIAGDDFESYATGTITSLTSGTNWYANGTFAIFP